MLRQFLGDVRALFTPREVAVDSVLLTLCLLAVLVPHLGSPALRRIERWGSRIALRKGAIVAFIALAIGLRLTVLWLTPVPVPVQRDEFGYLLAADTFAHGRLTNPSHPLGIFFETFHENMWPTYMSKWPPGQGAFLALGQRLGHPWIGVLLTVATMAAAGVWMLWGWFPSRWALLGGALLLLRLGIFNYWVNSYFGGAAAATGGALALGALPRITRHQRTRDALILALGFTLLANTRPLEGLVLALVVLAALLGWAFNKRRPAWRPMFQRLVLPFSTAMLLCALFIGYYNWRLTGSALLLPFALHERRYVSTPTLFWEKERAPLHYSNPQLEAFYRDIATGFWIKGRVDSVGTALSHILRNLRHYLYFFVWPELCIPLLVLPCALLAPRGRILILFMGAFFLSTLLNHFIAPHYFAPFTLVLFAIVIEGIRRLRASDYRGRRVGIAISRVVVLVAILAAPFHWYPYPPRFGLTRIAVALLSPIDPVVRQWQRPPEKGIMREEIERQLDSIPEESLVIVRYSSDHDVSNEWVYNRADIDHAKVVWAREIPGIDIRPLLDYFRTRRVWLLEPDADPLVLKPYS